MRGARRVAVPLGLGGMTLLLVMFASTWTRGGTGITHAQAAPGFRYSAAFMCGTHPDFPNILTATEINVHNPYSNPLGIGIKKKAVLAPTEPQVGLGGTRLAVSMSPDSAFEIDCTDIALTLLSLPAPVPTFFKGFVVIDSPQKIDVWGVYTETEAPTAPVPGVALGERKQIIQPQALPVPGPDPAGLAYTYSAKFLCGPVPEPFNVNTVPLVPATYGTDIVVHNPSDAPVSAGLLKKAVLAPREPNVGIPQPFVSIQVPSDGAFEDDCKAIAVLLGAAAPPPGTFMKGFLVIESPTPLDVVAIHIAEALNAQVPDGVGGDIDVDSVPFTRQPFPAPTPTPCAAGPCPTPTPTSTQTRVPCLPPQGLPGCATPTPTPTPVAKADLSPLFDCRHQHLGQNPSVVHVDCILLAAPLQPIFDWEVVYADQTPAMIGPAVVPWGCSPATLGWVPDTNFVSTRIKCEDQTHGSNPWLVGQCRDIDFAVPGAQGPWNPLVLHATDAKENNLGIFRSVVGAPPRC